MHKSDKEKDKSIPEKNSSESKETARSLKNGKVAIDTQKRTDGKSEDKSNKEESRDAERWRNEG